MRSCVTTHFFSFYWSTFFFYMAWSFAQLILRSSHPSSSLFPTKDGAHMTQTNTVSTLCQIELACMLRTTHQSPALEHFALFSARPRNASLIPIRRGIIRDAMDTVCRRQLKHASRAQRYPGLGQRIMTVMLLRASSHTEDLA